MKTNFKRGILGTTLVIAMMVTMVVYGAITVSAAAPAAPSVTGLKFTAATPTLMSYEAVTDEVVGTLSGTIADTKTIAYSISSDTGDNNKDAALFKVDGNELQIASGKLANSIVAGTYKVVIEAKDSADANDVPATLNVTVTIAPNPAEKELAKIKDLVVLVDTTETDITNEKLDVEAAILVAAQKKVAAGYTVTVADAPASEYDAATRIWEGKFVVTKDATDDIATSAEVVEVKVGVIYAGFVTGTTTAYGENNPNEAYTINGTNGSVNTFEVSLGTETMQTLPTWFTAKYYSIDGGVKWKKLGTKKLDGPNGIFTKLLSKEMTLWVTDTEPTGSTPKKPVNAAIVKFPKVSARPKVTDKIIVNYAVLSNGLTSGESYLSVSKWTLSTKDITNKEYAKITQMEYALSSEENVKVPGTWTGFTADTGIAVKAVGSDDYAKKTSYFIRQAAVVTPADSKYVPASKYKKYSVFGQLAAPKYSVKKDVIKYKKNTVVIAGSDAKLYTENGTIDKPGTYNFFTASTVKKPASAKLEEALTIEVPETTSGN